MMDVGRHEVLGRQALRVANGERDVVHGADDRPPQIHEGHAAVGEIGAPRLLEDLALALRPGLLGVVVVRLVDR